MDEEELRKKRWTYFWEHPIVKAFRNKPDNPNQFAENLVVFSHNDPEFQKETEIKELDANRALRVANRLKELIITKKLEPERISRRSFLVRIFSVAFVPVVTLAKNLEPILNQEKVLTEGKKQKWENASAQEIYDVLIKTPGLNSVRSVLTKYPNAPLIIIVEDVHGGRRIDTGWVIEYKRLELLRNNFGFNFVGIEGWAGHEVDKKRGIRVLNAEEILIIFLIKNKNYELIGLEDENAQRYQFIVSLSEDYEKLWKTEAELMSKLSKLNISANVAQEIFEYICKAYNILELSNPFAFEHNEKLVNIDIPEKCKTFFYKKTGLEPLESIHKSLEIKMDERRKLFTLMETVPFDERGKIHEQYEILSKPIMELSDKMMFTQSLMINLNEYLSTMLELRTNLYHSFFVKKIDYKGLKAYYPKVKEIMQILLERNPLNLSAYDYYTHNLREYYAVKRMLGAMRKENRRIGIVIFGRGHTKGLIQQFLNQTRGLVNIIVLELPKER